VLSPCVAVGTAIFTMIRLVLFSLLLLGLVGTVRGADKLWVGLYLGENQAPDDEVTVAPEKLSQRLHEVFGFTQYELIQGEEVNLQKDWEHWVLSRKDFFLRLQALPQVPGEPASIEYEIYKDGFIVAKGKYEVSEDTPLFINGPDFHQGRLIFVVEPR
jgi:hypothetical protein